MRIPSHVVKLAGERPIARLPLLSERLPVVREMLGMLDTQTIAGRRHLMTKVVDFVEPQVQRAAWRAGVPNRAVLLGLVTALRKESERLVPEPGCFVRQVESLISLLAPRSTVWERPVPATTRTQERVH